MYIVCRSVEFHYIQVNKLNRLTHQSWVSFIDAEFIRSKIPCVCWHGKRFASFVVAHYPLKRAAFTKMNQICQYDCANRYNQWNLNGWKVKKYLLCMRNSRVLLFSFFIFTIPIFQRIHKRKHVHAAVPCLFVLVRAIVVLGNKSRRLSYKKNNLDFDQHLKWILINICVANIIYANC